MSDSGNSSASEEFTVLLEGGRPWGFTLQGGADFRSPLKIGKITPNGRAQKAGLLGGDILVIINGVPAGQMKHHEAQRLIASSKATLELICMKGTQSIAFSPKSALAKDSNFDFPMGIIGGPGKSMTLGHSRQRSLDLNYRPRSTSDASKRATVGNKIAGITVPPPPPTKTRRVSEPHCTLNQTKSIAVTQSQPSNSTEQKETAESISVTQPSNSTEQKETAEPISVTQPSNNTEQKEMAEPISVTQPQHNSTEEKQTTEPVAVTVSSEQPQNNNTEDQIEADVPIAATASEQPQYSNSTGQKEAAAELLQNVIGSLAANKTNSQSEKSNEQESSHVTEDGISQEVGDKDSQTQGVLVESDRVESPSLQAVVSIDKPTETESDVSTMETKKEEDNLNEDDSDPEIFKGKDQDWYKSLFHTLQKGVDEDIPDKKPVWDRAPVPVRKSSHEFQSKTSPNCKYKNTMYNAPAFRRRSSESSLPSPTRSKPLKQSCSGSSIENRPADVVSGASPGVVFQKTTKKFNQSRNYWKSIEKQASIERIELATESKRNSLRRSSSANSTGSGNSPDVLISTSSPVKTEDKSFFKEEVLEVFSSCITEEEPPPTTVSPENKGEDNSTTVMAKLHPLLKDEMGGEETVSDADQQPQQNVFTRIDASKLNTAIGNAAVLGTMSQEGIDPLTLQSAALSINNTQPQEQVKAPVKKKKPKTTSPPPGKKARVKFDFAATTEKELDLNKGVVVTLLEQVDENWLKGEYEGQTGIFPLSYVQVINDLEEAENQPEPGSVNQLAKAKHDFIATTGKELSLTKGDIVTILKERDANWFEASMGDEVGIIPKSYVEIVQLENELQ